MYKEGNLTTEKLREAAVAWKDVFEEIPIHVRNSPLATALMASIEPDAVADTKDFERLHLGVRPLLEKNLEFLNDCLDDIVAEQQKVRPASILFPLPNALQVWVAHQGWLAYLLKIRQCYVLLRATIPLNKTGLLLQQCTKGQHLAAWLSLC